MVLTKTRLLQHPFTVGHFSKNWPHKMLGVWTGSSVKLPDFRAEKISCETPEVGGLPSGVSGVAMLPVGALCFYQAHFGRAVLPKCPFWKHLFYSVFYTVSELGRACFRQARVA